MQFYKYLNNFIRKAMDSVTIMVIPHSNRRKIITLKVPILGVALLMSFPFLGAVYLGSIIPDVIRYHSMKEQYIVSTHKSSGYSKALLSVQNPDNELYSLLFPNNVAASSTMATPVGTAAIATMDAVNIQKQIESAMQNVGAIKDYLHTEQSVSLSTYGKFPSDIIEIIPPSPPGDNRTLFHIKTADVNQYDQIIARVSRKYNVEAALIKAIIKAESNFDHLAVSPRGAQGLMQIMPQTVQSLQIEDSFHPGNNIVAGTQYLRYLLKLFDNDISLALAAYNAGESAVIKHNHQIPPYRETQAYVQRVLDHLDSYRQTGKNSKNTRQL